MRPRRPPGRGPLVAPTRARLPFLAAALLVSAACADQRDANQSPSQPGGPAPEPGIPYVGEGEGEDEGRSGGEGEGEGEGGCGPERGPLDAPLPQDRWQGDPVPAASFCDEWEVAAERSARVCGFTPREAEDTTRVRRHFGRRWCDSLIQSARVGRIDYDPEAAGRCLDELSDTCPDLGALYRCPDAVRPGMKRDEPCTIHEDCAGGWCLRNDECQLTCNRNWGGVGTHCVSTDDCQGDTWCDESTSCARPLPLGSQCRTWDRPCGYDHDCVGAPGAREGVCTRRPGVGEACGPEGLCRNELSCCRSDLGPGVCLPIRYRRQDEPCDGDCLPSLFCRNDGDGRGGRCVAKAERGAPCRVGVAPGDHGRACDDWLHCACDRPDGVDGVCVWPEEGAACFQLCGAPAPWVDDVPTCGRLLDCDPATATCVSPAPSDENACD